MIIRNSAGHVYYLGADKVHMESLYQESYTIIVARKGKELIVDWRGGSGGYDNWALSGVNWVRWGKFVVFHPVWNVNTMGKWGEVRPEESLPSEWKNKQLQRGPKSAAEIRSEFDFFTHLLSKLQK